jgi:hypothetical protein
MAIKGQRSALALALTLGLAAAAPSWAQTVAMKISDTAGNSVSVTSAGAVCTAACSTLAGYPQNTATSIVWSGQVGGFTISGASGSTVHASPNLDLGTTSVKTGATGGTLTITWTETGFYGSGPVVLTALTSVSTGSVNAIFTGYVDDTNAAFGTGINIGSLTSTGGSQFMVGGGPTQQPFSMTEIVSLTMQPNSMVNTDDSLQATPTPPIVVGCSTATAQTGTAYSSKVAVSGGVAPYTYSVISGVLPAGLGLNSTTGVISGTPTQGGPTSFTIQVVDASGNTGSNTATSACGISVQVVTHTQPLSLACSAAAATAGSPYNSSAAATGGVAPYTFTVKTGSLPSGLTMNAHTGAITGTPNLPGIYSFTLQVTDSSTPTLTATASCGLAVNYGTSTPLCHGDTATIGFWHNKNGQALINSMNGGSSSKTLATWLVSNYPGLFGSAGAIANLTGFTNAQVAAAFNTVFSVSGQKTKAQVFAGALALYVTNSALAGGKYAQSYGFNMSGVGSGDNTSNVGNNGPVLGLTKNKSYSLSALLAAANAAAPWSSSEANALNTVFSAINEDGDIN